MARTQDIASDEPLFEGFLDSGSEREVAKKRKRDVEEKTASKRRKSRRSKNVDESALDVDAGVNNAIAHMDRRLLADHIAQRTKRFLSDFSLLQLEECHVPEHGILDTTDWNQSRTKENLPAFLEHFARTRKKKGQSLSDAPPEKGQPHTLVIAGSGLRAADLVRSLRKFQGQGALVAKLFAKHIKLKEAVETVKKARINIGVGTPQRVMDLLDNGALSAKSLERMVIDASHIDQKKRGILDMKETQVPLIRLLARETFKERYGKSGPEKFELLFF